MQIDTAQLGRAINNMWDTEILPTLTDYIRIPCLSVDFDADWRTSGYLQQARELVLQWLRAHAIEGWSVHDAQLGERTPVIFIEIPGDSDNTILLYGHLDKQPEMEGWWEGFGPWNPIMQDGKLYGRGGADDGYAIFAAVAAIKAIRQQRLKHSRIVILIEFSEESGSPDLPPYLEQYSDLIGEPKLIIALDSGTGDYERLWSTTSLRGMLSCTVNVEVLSEATHSGIASGIVPSSMRIMRMLLDRAEDSVTGKVEINELHMDIPQQRVEQAQHTAKVLGDSMRDSFNIVPGLHLVSEDAVELLLNNTWRPTLCVVGQEGMPPIKAAGNVLRAYTKLKLSFRLPPTLDYRVAQSAIERCFTQDVPYKAKVSVQFDQGGSGWNAPPLAVWLEKITQEASLAYYGNAPAYFGLGASIPFMAMLGEQFPRAQFLITGVLGPKSNAHGPNEFIYIEYAKKLTACVAHIIAREFEC